MLAELTLILLTARDPIAKTVTIEPVPERPPIPLILDSDFCLNQTTMDAAFVQFHLPVGKHALVITCDGNPLPFKTDVQAQIARMTVIEAAGGKAIEFSEEGQTNVVTLTVPMDRERCFALTQEPATPGIYNGLPVGHKLYVVRGCLETP